MHYGRKRAIKIASIIIGIILILGVAGTIVYLKTDIFKSNQSLFFKYMEQAIKDVEYVPNATVTNNINRMNEEAFTLTGNLGYETEETSDVAKNALKNMKFAVEAKVDKLAKTAYGVGTLKNNDQDIFKVEYANTNNIYALKSDEVVTAFVGIENQNLKVLAQKLGITDTENLPNSISPMGNINEFLNLTDDEKAHIKETYLPVLEQNIEKANFTKNKDIAISKKGVIYNTTGYRLDLNEAELKQLEITLLQELKQDSITLNILATKAKMLNLDENYTNVNNLVSQIDTLINNINKENSTSTNGITITVYVENGKVITTEIIYKNEIKYTIYGQKGTNTNSYDMLMENLGSTEEYSKIEISAEDVASNNTYTINALINVDDEEVEINMDSTNDTSEDTIITNCEVAIGNGIINYEQEIAFQESITDITKVDRSNCAVLNDYPTEQLQVLIASLSQRIKELINVKFNGGF